MYSKRVQMLIIFLILLSNAGAKKVLLISLDGFRWDYFSKTDTPNFDALISDGVHVNQVENVFTTASLPNHYTLVTGLYEGEHGIIYNQFWDPVYQDGFNYGRDTKWFDATEPIWITAEREGKRSGVYMWVGGQAEYPGVSLSRSEPFDEERSKRLRPSIDMAVSWLKDDGLDLVCVYNSEPDCTGHNNGTYSPAMIAKISEIDGDIGYLRSELENAGLLDEINIVIVSDHGMADIAPGSTIDMSHYLNLGENSPLVEWFYFGVIGLIVPRPDMKQQVFDALNGVNDYFTVYKREDIPDVYHYKTSHNNRIPEIVVLPKFGYVLRKNSVPDDRKGQHGYDNRLEDMKSTFVAYGPDFKRGYVEKTMSSLDLYPLLCKVLGLKNCHRSSGDISHTAGFLNSRSNSIALSSAGGLGVVFHCLILLFAK